MLFVGAAFNRKNNHYGGIVGIRRTGIILAIVLLVMNVSASEEQSWDNDLQMLISSKQYDLALSKLNILLESETISNDVVAEALNLRGEVHKKKGNNIDAEKDFSASISMGWGGVADAYYNRALMRIASGDYLGCVDDFSNVIRINNNYLESYFERGNCYLLMGDYPRAISDYSMIISETTNENHLRSRLNRSAAYLKSGEFDKSISDSNAIILIDPDNEDAYENQALAYSLKEDYQSAILGFTKALELQGGRDHGLLYNRGVSYAIVGEQSLAESDFSSAIEIDGNNIDYYMSRGLLYDEMGQFLKAVSDYSAVVTRNNKFPLAYFHRGKSNLMLNRYDDAISDINKFASFGSENTTSILILAGAFFAKKKYANSIIEFERVIKLESGNVESNDLWVAKLNLAKSFSWDGQYSKSHDILIELMTKELNNPERLSILHRLIGINYFLRKDYEKSEHEFNQLSDEKAKVWGYLSKLRQFGVEGVASNNMGCDARKDSFSCAILSFLSNKSSKEELENNLHEYFSNKDKAKCMIKFYIGQRELVNGDFDRAETILVEAAKLCDVNSVEYVVAVRDARNM